MTYRTKRKITYQFGHACGSYSTDVPEGTRVSPIKDEPGMYWVTELPKLEAWARFDAEHYGIRVNEADVEQAQ